MPIVSDAPRLWPLINILLITSYVSVVCFTVVVYDWALTIGQEIELVWRQRWSLMTVLYLSIRYPGMLYIITGILLQDVTSISMTDAGCNIAWQVQQWVSVVANAMLGVIMMARLYAMYNGSRTILIFLTVILLATQIPTGVIAGMGNSSLSTWELVLSGNHMCGYSPEGDSELSLAPVIWILGTVWEVIALCFACWIAVKHFRELRQFSTGFTANDLFAALLKTHLLYFASFVVLSCLAIVDPKSDNTNFLGSTIYTNVMIICQVVQMLVLGPRLILGVREHNAKLVAPCDEGTGMASIAFQERIHISTGGGV